MPIIMVREVSRGNIRMPIDLMTKLFSPKYSLSCIISDDTYMAMCVAESRLSGADSLIIVETDTMTLHNTRYQGIIMCENLFAQTVLKLAAGFN